MTGRTPSCGACPSEAAFEVQRVYADGTDAGWQPRCQTHAVGSLDTFRADLTGQGIRGWHSFGLRPLTPPARTLSSDGGPADA